MENEYVEWRSINSQLWNGNWEMGIGEWELKIVESIVISTEENFFSRDYPTFFETLRGKIKL